MNTTPQSKSPGDRPAPIASWRHTILVLALLGVWGYLGAVQSHELTGSLPVNRVGFYLRTLVVEWVVMGIVVLGLRSYGSSLDTVLGERWHNWKEAARDIGIAAAFWIASTILMSVLFPSHSAPPNRVVAAILPIGLRESILWLALSITAGICEEAVYRGYLQRQLMAITTSVPAGIALSAIAFALAHSYQGWRGAVRVGVGGVLLGSLAYRRKSLRPGMMAHAFGDSFAGVFARLLKIRVG